MHCVVCDCESAQTHMPVLYGGLLTWLSYFPRNYLHMRAVCTRRSLFLSLSLSLSLSPYNQIQCYQTCATSFIFQRLWLNGERFCGLVHYCTSPTPVVVMVTSCFNYITPYFNQICMPSAIVCIYNVTPNVQRNYILHSVKSHYSFLIQMLHKCAGGRGCLVLKCCQRCHILKVSCRVLGAKTSLSLATCIQWNQFCLQASGKR